LARRRCRACHSHELLAPADDVVAGVRAAGALIVAAAARCGLGAYTLRTAPPPAARRNGEVGMGGPSSAASNVGSTQAYGCGQSLLKTVS
jgi:hypothetical protein